MFALALRNLLVKKARTALASTGLTIALLGIIALISLSTGIKALLHETLTLVPGLLVLQKDVSSPVLSSLPEGMVERIRGIPGVAAVIRQVFFPAFNIEGKRLYLQGDPFELFVVLGIDPRDLEPLPDGGIFARSLVEGRTIRGGGALEVMVSTDAVRSFKRKVGDTLTVQDRKLAVVGAFKVGSLLLDRGLVVDMPLARAMRGLPEGFVSCFYVEVAKGHDPTAVARAIETAAPGAWARTTEETTRDFQGVWGNVDLLLAAIAAIAVIVGAVGIVNTMLMSVMERTSEFGILRALGWRKLDVVRLVVLESSILGLVGGVLGCTIGAAGVAAAAVFLPLAPIASPALLATCLVLAVGLGATGGIYPAWHAARLDPIEAIRG